MALPGVSSSTCSTRQIERFRVFATGLFAGPRRIMVRIVHHFRALRHDMMGITIVKFVDLNRGKPYTGRNFRCCRHHIRTPPRLLLSRSATINPESLIYLTHRRIDTAVRVPSFHVVLRSSGHATRTEIRNRTAPVLLAGSDAQPRSKLSERLAICSSTEPSA